MLETFYESKALPTTVTSLLTPVLEQFYGKLAFPMVNGRPYVIGNFVKSVDGLVTSDKGARNPLFRNPDDRLLMSILRALADTVIVGKGTLLDSLPDDTWHWKTTVPKEQEAMLASFASLLAREELQKNVFVSASGRGFDVTRHVFNDPDVQAVIASTSVGSKHLKGELLAVRESPKIEIWPLDDRKGGVDLRALLAKLYQSGSNLILLEAGPRLYGNFEKLGLVDEIFLSERPLVLGNDANLPRPTFSAFSYPPGAEKKMNLLSLKKGAEDMLFFRWQYR